MSKTSTRWWTAAGIGAAAGIAVLWFQPDNSNGSTLGECPPIVDPAPSFPSSDGGRTCLSIPARISPSGAISVEVVSTNVDDPLDVDHVVFFHPGGPGISTTAVLDSIGQPLPLASTAFVAIDTQSSGAGKPGFCGAADEAFFTGRSTPQPEPDLIVAATEECKQTRIVASAERDAEVWELVRQKLGVGMIDVLSHSYGTIVAEIYARQHPEHVGRIVMDGVVGPGVPGDVRSSVVSHALARGWERLTRVCERVSCAEGTKALLSPGREYADVRARVLSRSATIGSGADTLQPIAFDEAVLAALRSPDNEDAFVRGIDAVVNDSDASVLFTMGERLGIGVDRTAFHEALCSSLQIRPVPTIDDDDLLGAAAASDLRLCTAYPTSLEFQAMYGTGDQPPPAVQRTADDPEVLVFGSPLDPMTPIALARENPWTSAVAGVCETDTVGHTTYRDPEARDLMTRFLSGAETAESIAARCHRN